MNKDLDIVTEEYPLIIFDRNKNFCMAKNGKDTKHTSHIDRKVHFVRNGQNCKIHIIDWCEGGLKLSDIATKNFGENDLNTIVKYGKD